MCYHCPVWTKTSSVPGPGKSVLKQPGSYCFAHVTPLSLMGSLLQMTSWEQAVKLCRSWRQKLLSVGPAPQSQTVREKDAEGSGSLVQISLLFFSWDIPWHGLRMRRWVGMIYSGCPSVLEMEETSCTFLKPSWLRTQAERDFKKSSWRHKTMTEENTSYREEKIKKIVEKCRRKLRTRKCRTSCVTRILADITVKTTLVFPGILKTANSSVWA